MSVLDIFSKRNKALPDVFVYDELPPKLRVQIVHILQHDMGDPGFRDQWRAIALSIAREHGLLTLPPRRGYTEPDHPVDCLNYVLKAGTVEALDLIELTLAVYADYVKRSYQIVHSSQSPERIAGELNHRFRENGCGYQYEAGRLVRVDSKFVHAEVVKPALALLRERGFEGPNAEYLEAHEHYRHGRIPAAITEAGKAFESTMKAICSARGKDWKHPKSEPNAVDLVKWLVHKELVPSFTENGLIHVATIRNRLGAHGGGAEVRDVPDRWAGYELHLVASNIVFLVECHKALK